MLPPAADGTGVDGARVNTPSRKRLTVPAASMRRFASRMAGRIAASRLRGSRPAAARDHVAGRRTGRARAGSRWLRWIEAGGAGKPRVILVHGAGDIALDWAISLPALAARYRVIAYDRAGLGVSDRIRGHSWGGLLVQLAAATQPKAVLGLVLLDPAHEEVTTSVPWPHRVVSSLMLNGIVLLKAAGLFNRIAVKLGRALAERCSDDPRTQALVTDAYLASYATISQVAAIRAENRLSVGSTDRLRAVRTASVTPDVPMRILTATRGKPPLVQQRAHDVARQTAARFPHGEDIAVPDSGHYIHKDQPAVVLAATMAVTTWIMENPPQTSAKESESGQWS